MSTKDHSGSSQLTDSADQRAADVKAISRRSLLKGSVVSMPAILTLHSGAALARSSNLISASPAANTDSLGRTLCLDVESVYPADSVNEVYDLDDPPYGRVSAINERDYVLEPRGGADRISEAHMCKQGGVFYHKGETGPFQKVNVPRGILVSSTALSSFAGDIVITDL